MVAPAEEVLLDADGDARLLRVHVHARRCSCRGSRARSRSASGASSDTARAAVTTLTMTSPGPAALAQHEEAEEPLSGLLLVGGSPASTKKRRDLVEERVHAVGLEQAALDVQHGVVAVRLVEPDDDARLAGGARRRATVNSILFR